MFLQGAERHERGVQMREKAIKIENVATKSTFAAWYELAKPGIVGLTLVAALTGIYFGTHGVMPQWDLIFWTFLTLGLATAGSCMLNNYYDRDIDARMRRTCSRSLASGMVSGKAVLAASLLITVISLALMAWMVGPLAAMVTMVGVVGYAGVYTMWLKRTTPWANQFGGIAGAVPPMVGYAAVTGDLGAPAWVLFAIMVIWQQPHALSLALKYREDYARARVPVIPVACGVQATKVRITLYALALFPATVLPFIYDMAGMGYLIVSVVLNTVFLYMAVRFLRSKRDCDMRVFAYSIVYLILLFGAMVLDAV